MKKLFGELNLTWKKVITIALIIGIYGGTILLIPGTKDTSLTDMTVTFEVWILFGILIIANSKNAKDSALKCFVFFLISQPLIYLIQDLVKDSNLFKTYYRYWFMWTIGCLPMGYIGYYIKKDKWWGLLILTPILILLGTSYGKYLSETVFSFPFHILTTIFCLVTLIIYPLCLFKNKKIKTIGLIISTLIILVFTISVILKPPVYSTEILADGSENHFDNTYKVYLEDNKYGKLSFKYEENVESWFVHAELKRRGKTKVILESPDGTKKTFDLTIKMNTYEIKEIK